MIYTVHPRTADDAVHLAALFALCHGTKPVSGRAGRKHRDALAESLTDTALVELLRDSRAIAVRPKSASSWAIEDLSVELVKVDQDKNGYNRDPALGRALRSGMLERGFNESQLAKASGVSQPAINNIVGKGRSPNWTILRKILAALGKDLHWLADAVDGPHVTP